jgi:hypothetical protein
VVPHLGRSVRSCSRGCHCSPLLLMHSFCMQHPVIWRASSAAIDNSAVHEAGPHSPTMPPPAGKDSALQVKSVRVWQKAGQADTHVAPPHNIHNVPGRANVPPSTYHPPHAAGELAPLPSCCSLALRVLTCRV